MIRDYTSIFQIFICLRPFQPKTIIQLHIYVNIKTIITIKIIYYTQNLKFYKDTHSPVTDSKSNIYIPTYMYIRLSLLRSFFLPLSHFKTILPVYQKNKQSDTKQKQLEASIPSKENVFVDRRTDRDNENIRNTHLPFQLHNKGSIFQEKTFENDTSVVITNHIRWV